MAPIAVPVVHECFAKSPIFERALWSATRLIDNLHDMPGLLRDCVPWRLIPLMRQRMNAIRAAQVLFIHVPKNAGLSVSHALYRQPVYHASIRFYRRFATDLAALPSFALWRDPVARFISAYRYGKTGGTVDCKVTDMFRATYRAFGSIEDALDHIEAQRDIFDVDHIFRPQHWYVTDERGEIAVDHLVPYHALARSAAAIGAPQLATLPWRNASKGVYPRVSAETAARIRHLYRIDGAIWTALTLGMATNEPAGHSRSGDRNTSLRLYDRPAPLAVP